MLDPAKTVVYTWSKNDVEHFETREDIRAMRQFQITIPFDPTQMEEYATPSRNTVAYYKLVKRNQEKQFMAYHFVPHILYQGTINITGLEIIEV